MKVSVREYFRYYGRFAFTQWFWTKHMPMRLVRLKRRIFGHIEICESCHARVTCSVHGTWSVEKYTHEDGPFYSCGSCVMGGAALGSIVHWCGDMIGMIGGKGQAGKDGDGRDSWSFEPKELKI